MTPVSFSVRQALLGVFALTATVVSMPSLAATTNWVGGTSTDWFDATNWLGSFVPITTDTAYLDSVSPNGTVISTDTATGSVYIARTGKGELTINNGAIVHSPNWTLGFAESSSGLLTITGPNSSWIGNTAATLTVGNYGNGQLLIENGGYVSSSNAFIGNHATSTSQATITGAGSRWNNLNAIQVGYAGTGSMTISDGAVVTSGGGGIANRPDGVDMPVSSGAVLVTGTDSRWDISNPFYVGQYGNGSLIIADGGAVNNISGKVMYIGLAVYKNSAGQVLVTGNGSSLVNDTNIILGNYDATGTSDSTRGSSGTLTVADNGVVSAPIITLGVEANTSGTVNIGNGGQSGTLNVASITGILGNNAVNFNHTDNINFSPLLTGSLAVNQINNGITRLIALNDYTGTTMVSSGILQAGAAGTFSAASDYTVGTAGQLDLAGFNQTLASLNNAGIVIFNGAPGTILTINGDYTGNNGLLSFNTILNDDTSATDKLVIAGNTTGTTRVSVTNAGGTGATTLNGIELIQVNGTSDGEFVQQGRIVAGAYDYSLARGVGANTPNWYLTSTASPVIPVDPVMVERPESGAYTANLAAANNMFVTRLHDRLGETQYIDALTGERKVTSLWLRNTGSHNRSRDTSGQLNTQANRYVMQLGGDIAQWSNNGMGRFHMGVMAGYGNSKSTTVSQVSGYNAKGTTDGYSTGVYGTWYANEADKSGLYVDGWAQYSWFNNTVDGQGLANEEYKSKGVTASVESGYTFKVGENVAKNATYFIQPKAQVTWMGVKADDHKEANGSNVSGEGDGNIQTRLGVKAFMNGYADQDKSKDRVFQPFVETNWIHNTKDFGTTMDGVTVKQDGAANIAEVKVGVEGQINKQVNLWGNVGQQVGNKGYSDTSVMLGVKYNF